MTVALGEVLMAPGGCSVECVPDPWLSWLLRKVPDEECWHLLYYRGAVLRQVYVVRGVKRSADAVVLSGPGPWWHAGAERSGPLILDQEFLAGHNKLSNGSADPQLGWLYWSRRGGSTVDIVGGGRTGSSCFRWGEVTGSDDTLIADDPGLGPCEPGQQHNVVAWVRRPGGSLGRFRLQAIYGGRFDHPDILDGAGRMEDVDLWTDESITPGDAELVRYAEHPHGGLGAARIGPTSHLQAVPEAHGDFTEVGTGGAFPPPRYWHEAVGEWAHNDTLYDPPMPSVLLTVGDGVGHQKFVQYDPAEDGASTRIVIQPGRWRYKIRGHCVGSGADGRAHISISVVPEDDPGALPEWHLSRYQHADPDNDVHQEWPAIEVEFDVTVPSYVLPQVVVEEHTSASSTWAFAQARLERIEGNTAVLVGQPQTVQPGRRYDVPVSARSDEQVTRGEASVCFTVTGPGRSDQIVHVVSARPTEGDYHESRGTLEIPSGYTTATPHLEGRDIENGAMWLDDLTVVDADDSTHVDEVVASGSPATWTQVQLGTTAPDGTRSITVAGVNEVGDGWDVDDFEVRRTGIDASTVAQVVEALLVHPRTGNPIFAAGDIVGPGIIAYDRRIRRQFPAQALHHLARSGLAGFLAEWRIRVDETAGFAYDFGPADDLFTHRDDIVFSYPDAFLLAAPEIAIDAHEWANEVLVIGATRAGADGERVITGAARRTGTAPRDWHGHAVDRTEVVEDSTVDYRRFAIDLAELRLDAQGRQPATLPLQLSDTLALGEFDVGDWVRLHDARARIWDPTAEQFVEGRIVFGQEMRVVARTLHPAKAGSRMVLREQGGEHHDITELVRWESATTAEVELGEMVGDFVVDPEGGAPGRQLARHRASLPS